MQWKYMFIETDSSGSAVIIEMPLTFSALRGVTYVYYFFIEIGKNGSVTMYTALIFRWINGTKQT